MNDIVGPHRDRKAVRFDTRLPMKYIIKSALMKTPEAKEAVVINMSAEGLRFETNEQLPEGVAIAIEVFMPGDVVIQAAGEVKRITPVQRKESKFYECALSFTEISDTAREEINMWYYSEKFTPGRRVAYLQQEENRESERFRVGKAFAEYRKKGVLFRDPWQQAVIKQVSKHGLVLVTRSIVLQGEVWEIIMHLVAYHEPVKAAAKVLRVKREGFGSEVALQFIKIKSADREKLSESAYVKELIDKSDAKLP